MTRFVLQMCRILRLRYKCYIGVVFVWLTTTYVLVSVSNTDDTRTRIPTQSPHSFVVHDACNCTCENDNKRVSVKNSNGETTPKPNKRTGFVYTVQELLSRARSDPAFLERLLNQYYLHKDSKDVIRCFLTDKKYPGFEHELNEPVNLQTNHNILADVIVFLHIQKTGGWYFNERLKRLKLPFTCACGGVIPCLSCRPSNGSVWMYSWTMTGWKCGLHADWTQMHRCMPELIDRLEGKHRSRRYFYITQLRHPIYRYLSEWSHQHGGNHWQDATLGCGRGVADWMDIRPCFIGESWKGVTLDGFMDCPHNLATNRQARMLADLNLTNCYRHYSDKDMKIKRAHSWVKSAMLNLKRMEYFAIMEDVTISDKMFKKTFGLELIQGMLPYQPKSKSVTEDQFMRILRLVELDIHVYMFAKELIHRRAKELGMQS